MRYTKIVVCFGQNLNPGLSSNPFMFQAYFTIEILVDLLFVNVVKVVEVYVDSCRAVS